MKFMVEFPVRPGNKNKVVEAFDERGPSRNAGVMFRNAWIGKNDDVVFVLVESAEESLVNEAAKSWNPSGNFRITPVIDFENF